MSSYVVWFVLGFLLMIAEAVSGTFYLLVVAVALAAGGVIALAGLSFAWQLLVAAVIGLGGSFALHRWRRSRPQGRDAAQQMQHMDVGQTLRIDHWSARNTARANYRGAQWDIELAAGESAMAGDFVIREIHANRLVVAACTGETHKAVPGGN